MTFLFTIAPGAFASIDQFVALTIFRAAYCLVTLYAILTSLRRRPSHLKNPQMSVHFRNTRLESSVTVRCNVRVLNDHSTENQASFRTRSVGLLRRCWYGHKKGSRELYRAV